MNKNFPFYVFSFTITRFCHRLRLTQEPAAQTSQLNWIVGKQVQISVIRVTSAKIIVSIDDSQGILGAAEKEMSSWTSINLF